MRRSFHRTAGKSGSASLADHAAPARSRMRPPMPLTRSVSLRWRVTLLAASVVAIAVAVMAIAAYAVVSRALYADVDNQLRTRASALIDSNLVTFDPRYIAGATLVHDGHQCGADLPGPRHVHPAGVQRAHRRPRTVRGARRARHVVAYGGQPAGAGERTQDGSTLVIAQRLAPTGAVLDRLAWVLFIVGGCGVVLAAAAGTTVGRTGLRPIARLTAATERVARTDDLTPMPVTGNDELARLTESFNTMLRALAESRERQSRLVADAGHELRTPLTSLRTNMELLIASSRPGAPHIPDEDMAESAHRRGGADRGALTLGGRPRGPRPRGCTGNLFERVDLSEVVERSLERARRRRNEIDFTAVTVALVRLRRPRRAVAGGAQRARQRREVESDR